MSVFPLFDRENREIYISMHTCIYTYMHTLRHENTPTNTEIILSEFLYFYIFPIFCKEGRTRNHIKNLVHSVNKFLFQFSKFYLFQTLSVIL